MNIAFLVSPVSPDELILSCLHFHLQVEILVNGVFIFAVGTEYLGDPSMPVSFGPSRINPHIIKNSLVHRRLVLSWRKGSLFGSKRTFKGEKMVE